MSDTNDIFFSLSFLLDLKKEEKNLISQWNALLHYPNCPSLVKSTLLDVMKFPLRETLPTFKAMLHHSLKATLCEIVNSHFRRKRM